MKQDISQEEIRRIIISDMVKKRGSIVPVIGENTVMHSFCLPLLLLGLSYGLVRWIRCAFKDVLKAMRRYMPLTGISVLAHEAGFVIPRTHVHETMNFGSIRFK